MRPLTVQPNRAVGLAARVFRHALVHAVVGLRHVHNGQLHLHFVRRRALYGHRLVLTVVVQHLPAVPGPVMQGRGVRLGVTLQRHVVAQRHADQLMRYP